MTTKIPKTRPALAPIDILLLAAASDEVGLALERARDAVAEAKPAIAPVPVGTGEEVATMIVDAKCFGDVLAVAVSSGFSFLDVAVAFFDLGFEVALDADEICRTGSPMTVFKSPLSVIQTTGTVHVFFRVTT
jgi:hypothetical protein